MSKQTWYSMRAARDGKSAEIAIYSDIGAWGVSAGDFHRELRGLGDVKRLNILISSDGGDVSHGIAIFNSLEAHPAQKIVTVMGLAASMASVIAMVGDEVRMPRNAMLMIHEPWGGMLGRADELESFAGALKKMGAIIRDAYVKRTGLPRAEVAAMMDKETWLDAEEAVDFGFADKVIDPVQLAASAKLDISKFHNAPEAFGRTLRSQKMTKQVKGQKDENENDGEDIEAKTPEQIRAELVAEQNEIRSLCLIAGKPEAAEKFIADNKTPVEVREALAKAAQDAADAAAAAKAKGKKPGEISAHNTPGASEGGTGKEIDAKDIFDRFNKKGKYAA